MTAPMQYKDNIYAVELFDEIELHMNGRTFEGKVTKLHPRSEQVTVQYEDFVECRRDGTPITRSKRVSVRGVDLIRMDG